MTYQPAAIDDDLSILPKLPAWVTSGRAETLETVAFRSGAALTVLDQLVGDPSQGVPLKLLANQLALQAATATSKLEGRLAREADMLHARELVALIVFSELRYKGRYQSYAEGHEQRTMS